MNLSIINMEYKYKYKDYISVISCPIVYYSFT